MHLTRSTMAKLELPDSFEWLAGIEDTFITAPSPKTGRTLDEYELTEHYARWRDDVGLFAELGLKAVRYGVPWHIVNPAPGRWDFTWVDGPLERLLELGIQPVVDLVHYGLPAWIDGAYLHPDYDHFVAEYAARVAERYKGRIYTYTPLNEPRIAGWYCGRLGWWPPARRGWRGFVSVMLAVCRGIVRTVEAQRAVDPEIVHAHVDATDLYEAASEDLAAEAARRQAIVFLALDLITGRVDEDHELASWLLAQGATPSELDWFGGTRSSSTSSASTCIRYFRGNGSFGMQAGSASRCLMPARQSSRRWPSCTAAAMAGPFLSARQHRRAPSSVVPRGWTSRSPQFGGCAREACRWSAIRGGRFSPWSLGATAKDARHPTSTSSKWVCGTCAQAIGGSSACGRCSSIAIGSSSLAARGTSGLSRAVRQLEP